ncbi:MAG: ABC transporter permease [Acidimicrobiales bacterium]
MKRSVPWRVVVGEELRELWLGPRGLTVVFAFSIVLSAMAYLASVDAGINLLDARESVGIVVQLAIALGTLAALVISADAIAGERERGTLEALLVTPAPRRHIVIGKLLAATTVWVAALIVALPYVAVMADGVGVVADGVIVLVVVGGLVAAALTALGLAISSFAMSNRVSLAMSVTALLILAAPSQLPSVKASGTIGTILVRANPVSAGLRVADRVLVKQQPWDAQLSLLLSPLIATVVFTAIAVALASRLELGSSR